MLFHGPARKKAFQQLVIHGDQILADNLERRLVAFWRYQDCFVNLANRFTQMDFQLPVAVGLPFSVRMLFFQGVDGSTNIVPVFFEGQAQGVILTGFTGAARFFKLRFAEFCH